MNGRTSLSTKGTGASARYVKRAIDLVVGGLLLVLLAPVMAVVALALLVHSGRPALFRQVRPGLHQVPWTMCKFRTMRPARDRAEFWHGDDERTTKLGLLLRRTSLDELPQLVHVVTGRMSLVGPRPLLMEYLPRYSAHHLRRHEMRPGITGLAQVSGRSWLTMRQRLDLDVRYVDEWSLWLDLRILARTLIVPFQQGHATGQTIADIDDLNLCGDRDDEPVRSASSSR
ncbi:sugar transferase [Phytohabitans houttuyneae]|uniref:Sugar transferase n=1 Tax=Phytohabitans houttuyneae TaxID=1076126 RepID=A0A6V8K8U8_9ACTN|nr:sugar transferase [Phytohabitans houttuyneae]GFJ81632.1 sugar transferase [Phytohabitans houttuyneae]